jgi:hypothetical protein
MSLVRSIPGALAVALLAAGDPVLINAPTLPGQLRAGMTPAEVRLVLGPPHRIARQILYHRYLEQWLYNAPASLRVDFDFPRGQAARLVSVAANTNEQRP